MTSLVAIVLVLLGSLHLWLVLGIMVPLGLAIAVTLVRTTDTSIAPQTVAYDVLIVLFAAAWIAFNSAYASQHLFVDRDPGFYANTAVWIRDNPDLDLRFEDPFSIGTQIDSPGLNSRDGHQYVQGTHTYPTMLGLIGRLTSISGMFKLAVLFGGFSLLAVYSLGRQLASPRWAFAASALLSVMLPFIYFSRESYTEPITMMAAFSGFSLMTAACRKPAATSLWFLSGVAFAAAVVMRIDGLLLMAPLIGSLAVLPGKATAKNSAVFALPLIGGAYLLWLDVSTNSPFYYSGHSGQMGSLAGLAVLAGVLGAILVVDRNTVRYLPRAYEAAQAKVSPYWLMVTIIAIGALAASRPLWYIHYGDKIDLRAQGQQRLFGEITINWLMTYIGPVASALAVVGFCLVAVRLFRGTHQEFLPWFLVFSMSTALYINNPNITPDHIWASRRFLPIVFPSLALFCAVALDFGERRLFPAISRPKLVANYVLAGFALTVFPVGISQPYVFQATNENLETVESICAELDRHENPAVIWVGSSRVNFTFATNTVCQKRATTFNFGEPTPESFREVMEGFDTTTQTAIIGVLESNMTVVEGWEEAGFSPVADVEIVNIEQTLVKKPTELKIREDRVMLARLLPDGTLTWL